MAQLLNLSSFRPVSLRLMTSSHSTSKFLTITIVPTVYQTTYEAIGKLAFRVKESLKAEVRIFPLWVNLLIEFSPWDYSGIWLCDSFLEVFTFAVVIEDYASILVCANIRNVPIIITAACKTITHLSTRNMLSLITPDLEQANKGFIVSRLDLCENF